LEISNFKFPISSTTRAVPRRSLAARAILFVALSAFAVPACQHFEGEGSHESTQALQRRPAPAAVTAAIKAQPA